MAIWESNDHAFIAGQVTGALLKGDLQVEPVMVEEHGEWCYTPVVLYTDLSGQQWSITTMPVGD
jgi:hypothetical protein